MKTVSKQIVTTTNVKVATIEDFTSFLEERKMLGKFIHYCESIPIVETLARYRTTPFIATQYHLKEWCEFLKVHAEEYDNRAMYGWWEFIIKASFRWNSVTDGYDTWCVLNGEWLEWLEDNGIEDFEI